MEKVDIVLAVFDKKFFESAVKKLNFDSVNLTAIFMDGGEKFFKVGEKQIPIIPFANLYLQVKNYINFLWLVDGFSKVEDFQKIKKFLMTLNISEKNIVNFETASKISPVWLANFWKAKIVGADFFATGNEFMRDNLNLKFIPHENGVNLADVNQNLRQSYLIAKNIFETTKPGTIKFVLIGLSPDIFCRDNSEKVFDFQYLNFLSNSTEQADLNFDGTRKNLAFSAKSIIDWNDDEKNFSADVVETNFQILQSYIKLCRENGAEPVGVTFPVAPAARKTYNQEILKIFLQIILNLMKIERFICANFLDMNLNYDCFSGIMQLNFKGQMISNARLSMILYKMNLVPVEGFCNMTYEYLNSFTVFADKDDYNLLAKKIFDTAAKKIAAKDKIKIGFVMIDASQWSGDDLYNLFANDERFETTIFNCLRADKVRNDLVVKDFWRGVEQFKKRGFNMMTVDNPNANLPAQDVLISLTPYRGLTPKSFKSAHVTLKTLVVHIPYSFSISVRAGSFYNETMFNTAWKIFFSSDIGRKVYATHNKFDLPRGIFSGYPRMDIFFSRNANFHFDWKMARPDAKKIIYAPHWSINSVTKYATFQWNYKFMYEFAKNHPEISWVVKPHQALFFSTVNTKVFSSTKEYEEYLQMWNDLPNAQVYTGAYYQGLFATSDGMIHDSGSFIAEYQFVNKPMIFLTRAGERFNKLGEEILKASYLVDGKDVEKIAETMQKVFIEGKDDKAPQRAEVYKKYLDYPNYTGMLASTFIYKSIADGLKDQP